MTLFQLKDLGESGVHMECVQEHVIVPRPIAEQEIIQVVQCHVQAMLQKWLLVAKVKPWFSFNNLTKS